MSNDAKDKIRSLLAKATDPAASPDEAEGALRMAQKLMARHGLTEAEIAAKGSDAFIDASFPGRTTKHGVVLHPVDRMLGQFIAKFCGCKYWRHNKADGTAASVYFGEESDVEFALHLRGAWMTHFDHDWIVYKDSRPRLRDLPMVRQSFSEGFATEMRKRLEDWMAMRAENAPTDGDTHGALVVQKLDLVQAEMARRGIILGMGRAARDLGHDAAAAGAGMMAAKSAGVGRGVGGGVKMIGAR